VESRVLKQELEKWTKDNGRALEQGIPKRKTVKKLINYLAWIKLLFQSHSHQLSQAYRYIM